MKKRWFLTSLFALTLFVCAASAQAAVVSGGTEYVWYTDMGRGYINENNQFVSNEGQQLYLSADQGGSYAVLPGLGETQKQTGLSYIINVEANAANDGGLSVKARDTWSSEYTWFRDYSAQEIAAALKNTAKATPVRVYATNGTVTVGTREVHDWGNGDPTKPNYYGRNESIGGYNGDRIVYSTDGVTWFPAEQEKEKYYSSIKSGWWDGSAFHAGNYVSADGIHWTKTEEDLVSPKLRYSCELGDYHFEVVNTSDWQNGNDVYLTRRGAVDTGVLLPDLGNAIRAMGLGVGDVQAWYTPNDTVTVAFYDFNQGERYMYSLNYPISSLEWCLDNLSVKFRDVEVKATSGELGAPGTIALGVITASNDGYFREQGELIRYTSESGGWQKVPNVPWGRAIKVLPYNGKTFMVQDMVSRRLYVSPDGISWSEVPALRPQDPGFGGGDYDYLEHAVAWSGKDYIACRKAGVRRHGMMGHAGGQWYDGNTRVYFLNEALELTFSYDFGRLVMGVGFCNGSYYAKVANSEGHRDGWAGDPGVFNEEGSALYRSADGKNWEKLPDIYIDYEDIMISTKGGSGVGNRPTGDANKPQHSIARLDRWRFVLDEYVAWDFERNVKEDHPTYRVYLMGDSAADWVELPHLREAIQAQGIEAWELSAAYNPDGTVEVKITDKSDANKYISISYPTSSLDWVKENLMGINGRELPAYSGTNNDVWDIESKYGVADLIAVELANGENELVYRTPGTGGHWHYFDSVPWGNEIALLEFSGKDFMVLDKADGKLYLSSDGVNWHEAAGEWYREQQKGHYRQVSGETENGAGCYEARYAMKWTGDKYMAVCFWCPPTFAVATKVVWGIPNDPNMAKVLYLDEELNLIGSHDFGYMMTGVGYQDGKYFAFTDGHIYQGDFIASGPERLFLSTDGENWMESGLLSAQACLVELQ